ncbi:hypothetical protein V5O48_010800 [Marasmius crinis-equi]|uniref:Uncharacterized protein n=1 Tax=Marasmius crinis-equi TaxID=585013 RepID=A0ABR3F7E2_9AGAR
MHHLTRNCRGERQCLDALALRMSIDHPGQTLSTQYFEFLNTDDRALLTLAARLCPDICDNYLCVGPNRSAHYVDLEIDNGILKVARRGWMTTDCGCERILFEVPKDLSKCITGGLETWRALVERRERILNTDPSEYRSPSPDLPPLSELFERTQRKRPAEDPGAESPSESSDDERPPPAKRMRTGPCRDIMRKIEQKKAEKKVAEPKDNGSEEE